MLIKNKQQACHQFSSLGSQLWRHLQYSRLSFKGVSKPMASEAEERSTTITTAPSISCKTYAGKLLLYCSINFTINSRLNLLCHIFSTGEWINSCKTGIVHHRRREIKCYCLSHLSINPLHLFISHTRTCSQDSDTLVDFTSFVILHRH